MGKRDDFSWVDRMFDPDEPTEAYARTTDPTPSQEAADRMKTTKAEARVYRALLDAFPRWLTVVQIAEATGMTLWSTSPRMAPLWRKGYVESTEIKAPNSTGNIVTMTAWRAK